MQLQANLIERPVLRGELAELSAAGAAMLAASGIGRELTITRGKVAQFTPGTAMKYTNTNYIIAGLLIESVTGRPAAEEITWRIIVPLGLFETYFPAPGDTGLRPPFAHGYEVVDGRRADVTDFNASAAGMAGSLVSTNEDTSAFITALLDGRVIPQAQLDEMMDTVPMPDGDGIVSYGLGLMRVSLPCGVTAWGQALQQGQGDAALAWAGLRAQWKSEGLDFEYWLGKEHSKFPANSFVIRSSDFEDESTHETYEKYLRGWAMGLEFGYLNPRAATHIVMEQFPSLQLTPEIATESMMQLGNVFRGDFAKRKGWGWHDMDSWALFLKTIKDIDQIPTAIKAEDVVKNDYVEAANNFDKAKVKADADGYKLPDDYSKVDVDAIAKRV